MAETNSNTDYKIGQAVGGLNTDGILPQLKPGQMTFAKNAVVENFDGNMLTYQNEQSNYSCLDFSTVKPGFYVIGLRNIVEQNRTIFFIVNPTTGDCEIGQKVNDGCTYSTIISSPCLNFNRNYPIHKVVVKTTNCSTQIYWTDKYNPRRWMDFDDLPFREIPDPENEFKTIKVAGDVDCNKLLVQPNFSVPIIIPNQEEVGGQLVMGAYQFGIQYANSLGEGYTSFYAITNPLGIFESKVTPDFNLPTTKAISVHITDLDTTGLYDYFNLVAIKTINNITTPELIGTYPINGKTDYDVLYTGAETSNIQLSMNDVFERFPYYDIAGDLTTTDNTLFWLDLAVKQKAVYQKIWSQVKLYWEEWIVPVNKFEGYVNSINTGQLRGWMRDEVHAIEGCFLLTNGKITDSSSLISRAATPFDREIITNEDAHNTVEDPCQDPQYKERWEVYNTASVIDFCDEYKNAKDKSCYIGPYRYGEFGYWQSAQNYPNNRFIWGDNAGQPIRHFKTPDCLVSPIHSNNTNNDPSFEYHIFPMGIRVDMQSLYDAIQNSDLTQEEKDQIQGFKILRGNRATNKSVIAKGMFFNVGEYNREGSKYFFPNYPLNDLNDDVFLADSTDKTQKPQNHSGDNANKRLKAFGENSKSRFTFHSPDTSFYQPFGVDSGYIKMETVEYGRSRGHFVPIKDNAEYKFLTKEAVGVAFASGMSSIVGFSGGFRTLSSGVDVQVSLNNIMPTMQTTLELLKNLTPFTNYGYNFNIVGSYNNSFPIPNSGDKVRAIDLGEYLRGGSGTEPVGDINPINNFDRESSVYVKVGASLPFPHEVDSSIPTEVSRYTIGQTGCSPTNIIEKDVCSYYGSIKRLSPDQWGKMYSYETIDTGFYSPLYNTDGSKFLRVPTVFGGDTYINRFALKRKLPFFIDNTVSKPQGADINLDDLGNIGNPIYYYSTKPVDVNIDIGDVSSELKIITDMSFGTVASNLLSAGIRPFIAGLIVMTKVLQAYVRVLGTSNVNLDCTTISDVNETGYAYQFAYGIPYFFVESEVNVDFRQAYNTLEGDFYPHVSTDIPDDWLQQVNVPIRQDNTYTYNKSYSKQNKETYFSHLREDFDPNKLCFTNFPNRVIYSQMSTLEETKNNWLVYRPISYYDFPKNYGLVTAIDGLEDRKMLVRFENKSMLYNVLLTTEASAGYVYLGKPNFFSGPPLDFAETDLGYMGSQHKLLLRTEAGHFITDAKRGQVFLYRGQSLEEISNRGLEKWFTENIEFQISKYFPGVNTDNHFKYFGITGVYDPKYNRIILTKKDYIPLDSNIRYDSEVQEFYIHDNEYLNINDPKYFCNVSWTLSYSVKTGSWVSFHSYTPNYYIGHPGFFETGNNSGVFVHNKAISFQNFYGKTEDYILEYPIISVPNEDIITSFTDYTTILKYTDLDTFYEVEDNVYFNEAWVYNNQQFTGRLKLIPKPKGNLSVYMQYPKYKSDSKEILVTKSDDMFSFNQFWDIVKVKNKPFFLRPCDIVSLDKITDNSNLDYGIKSHHKTKIRGKEAKIRLIQNATDQYKFISKFVVAETQKSFK